MFEDFFFQLKRGGANVLEARGTEQRAVIGPNSILVYNFSFLQLTKTLSIIPFSL